MTKDEYIKSLQKWKEDNIQINDDYGSGYSVALQDAINVAEKLDEPEKVVIPEFIANDIDRCKKKGLALRGALRSAFHWKTKSDVYNWFYDDDGDENFMKYISAWNNGYKVDKPRRVVKLKGIHGARKYIRLDDEGKVILGLAGSDGITGGALTEEEVKEKWPEFEIYYNAGLLEFEEVEDDN